MKKLVLKTALITLASIIAILGILYGVFALFFPKTLAKTYESMGYDQTAIKYYEKQYEKTQDVQDLITLCVRLDVYSDTSRAEKYLSILVAKPNFYSTCLDNDVNVQTSNQISSEEYFEGKWVVATYLKNGVEKAIENAIYSVRKGNYRYTEYNAFFMLYSDNSINWTESEQKYAGLSDMHGAIHSLCDNGNGESELNEIEIQIATRDLFALENWTNN